jgi:hypothetical protein
VNKIETDVILIYVQSLFLCLILVRFFLQYKVQVGDSLHFVEDRQAAAQLASTEKKSLQSKDMSCYISGCVNA